VSFTRLVNRSWVERLERKERIKGHKRAAAVGAWRDRERRGKPEEKIFRWELRSDVDVSIQLNAITPAVNSDNGARKSLLVFFLAVVSLLYLPQKRELLFSRARNQTGRAIENDGRAIAAR